MRVALFALLVILSVWGSKAESSKAEIDGSSTPERDGTSSYLACVSLGDESAVTSCLASRAPTDAEEARGALEKCLLSGWWDAAATCVDSAHAGGFDVSTKLHQVSSMIRTRLAALAERLAATKASAGIPPAFEWAQSADSLFFNVKWTHKLDAPATLGCEAGEPEFGASSVRFRAECPEKRKAFLLSLALYANISAEGSSWSPSSVGRALLTLRKAQEGPWPRLLASTKKLPNQHIWWAMAVRSRAGGAPGPVFSVVLLALSRHLTPSRSPPSSRRISIAIAWRRGQRRRPRMLPQIRVQRGRGRRMRRA